MLYLSRIPTFKVKTRNNYNDHVHVDFIITKIRKAQNIPYPDFLNKYQKHWRNAIVNGHKTSNLEKFDLSFQEL